MSLKDTLRRYPQLCVEMPFKMHDNQTKEIPCSMYDLLSLIVFIIHKESLCITLMRKKPWVTQMQ